MDIRERLLSTGEVLLLRRRHRCFRACTRCISALSNAGDHIVVAADVRYEEDGRRFYAGTSVEERENLAVSQKPVRADNLARDFDVDKSARAGLSTSKAGC